MNNKAGPENVPIVFTFEALADKFTANLTDCIFFLYNQNEQKVISSSQKIKPSNLFQLNFLKSSIKYVSRVVTTCAIIRFVVQQEN